MIRFFELYRVPGPGVSGTAGRRLFSWRPFLLCLLGALIVSPTILAKAESVSLAASSQAGLQFEVHPAADLSNLIADEDTSGAAVWARPVLVAMPYGATCRIVSAEGFDPVPLDPDRLYGRAPASLPIVSLSQPIEVRGRRFVVATVHPVQGKTVLGRVVVELAFDGGTSAGAGSPDPVFDRALASVVVNYEDAVSWRAPSLSRSRVAAGPFEGGAVWYKLAIENTGLHRLSGTELAAAGVSALGWPSTDLRVFTGGGLPVAIDNAAPRPLFSEVSLWIDDGGDGTFDAQDYLYFFGEALDRWRYPSGEEPAWYHHPYARRNVYWLTIAGTPGEGLRMSEEDVSPGGSYDTVITSGYRRVHTERDSLFSRGGDGRLSDYYHWYWTDREEVVIYLPVENLVDGGEAEVTVAARLPRAADPIQLKVNGEAATATAETDTATVFATRALRDGLNSLRMVFVPNTTIKPYLDFVDLAYPRYAVPESDRLDLVVAPAGGRARVEVVDAFDLAPALFDLSDPLHPKRLVGAERSDGRIAFEAPLDQVSPSRLLAVPPSLASGPAAIERVEPLDLRSGLGQTDVIMVTARAFVPALGEYADYRRADGYSVKIVAVEDIYDNFSWGLLDPAAIRDFLKFAYENYPVPAPSVALFVGDGSYDFLGLVSSGEPQLVPPFINAVDDSRSYSDDNYVYFGDYGVLDYDSSYISVPDRGTDMITARWAVQSVDEIATIVDKTRRYESSSDFGSWRATICLVADDEFADGRTNETDHTVQTEELQAGFIPRVYKRDKIYAIEHPFVGGKKPSVNDAIVDAFNEGRLIVNYVGHGNPGTWAHEYVFTNLGDLPRLNNYDRLPLVFAASCAIGFFDGPAGQGMAEELLLHPGGGAVAVVSATRLVWSSLNQPLNQLAFELLLGEEDLTMCEALYLTKLIHQYSSTGYSGLIRNDRSYVFMGDPFVKLARPALEVAFDSSPDSLVALQPARITGYIRDAAGLPLTVSGSAEVAVYDTDRNKLYDPAVSGGSGLPVEYAVDGALIYRGAATVTDGSFAVEFVPPLDIGYGGRGAHATVYAQLDTIDAAGIVDSMVVSDSIAASGDSQGPVIEYSFAGHPDFAAGDAVGVDESLEVVLSDSSGINLTGGLGHGISLEIDGRSDQVIRLTDLFAYDQASYTTGRLQYGLSTMTPGWHRFKLKAWDNANNSATAEFDVEVLTGADLAIRDLLNYPNPMQDSTVFSFVVTQAVERVSLAIYTLSGRKIRNFDRYSVESGYHDDIVWRGEDFAGDRVATGVYIYRASAQPRSGEGEVEAFGKVVVLK